MKAEHRKELETNLLADRLGRIMQTVKTGPKGLSRFKIFLIVVAVLVVGLPSFIFWRIWVTNANTQTVYWEILELGSKSNLNSIAKTAGAEDASNPAKAAALQLAQLSLRDEGLRSLGNSNFDDRPNALAAFRKIDDAQYEYENLKKPCEKSDEWMAEILYSQAVIEETRALQSTKHLESAQSLYEELSRSEKYAKTGWGELAKQRAKDLKDNATDLAQLYQDLGKKLQVRQEDQPLGGAQPPAGQPPVFQPPAKGKK